MNRSRHAFARAGLACLAVGAWLAAPAFAQTEATADLGPTLDRIARGDEVESREAMQRLIRRTIDPIVEAIGPLEGRPPEEQVRLRLAVAKLAAELNYRVRRADLPAEERRLLDAFAASYEELIAQLFDSNYKVRMAAVGQIPLEPGSGAGVLIAMKVDDEDEDVAAAALDAALKLKDEVVARNLARYVRGVVEALRNGYFGRGQQEIALAVAHIASRACTVIGESGHAASAPVVIEALDYLRGTSYWQINEVEQAVLALGRLGDERAAPLLIELLSVDRLVRIAGSEGRPTIVQTLGDLSLLSLSRIYRIEPAAFGLTPSTPPGRDFAGYESPEKRAAGLAAFRAWHRENATLPAAERKPPASRPAADPAP